MVSVLPLCYLNARRARKILVPLSISQRKRWREPSQGISQESGFFHDFSSFFVKDAWRPLYETLREKPQNRNCKYLQFLGWGRGTKKERFMSFKLGFRKLGRFSNGFEQQFAWGEGVSLRQRMRMSRVSGKECLLSIVSVFKKNRRKKYKLWFLR